MPASELSSAYGRMQAAGVTPDVFTYSSLTSAYDKKEKWQMAKAAAPRVHSHRRDTHTRPELGT
jgi:hypothetical protein